VTDSRWARTLTNNEPNPQLDLDAYVGQRSATFEFVLVDSKTGYSRQVYPVIRGDIAPMITHNVSRTIKRDVSNLFLDVADTAEFNSITSRLHISMLIGGVSYPLGVYIPNNWPRFVSTAGTRSAPSFYDEGFIVDQPITRGLNASDVSIFDALAGFLNRYPIEYSIEPSPYGSSSGWAIGTPGGYVVEQLALDGGWFSPWFDNNNVMQFIQAFDPATAVPDFDLDSGNRVLRDTIVENDDLIYAPNRFIIISNGLSNTGEDGGETVGVYDVPSSAPHSLLNRGFEVPQVEMRQLLNGTQAAAVARNYGLRYTIFETTELTTPPDPRHDGYNVIRWRGENWLEIAWTMQLIEGGSMSHTLKKAYGD